jgi:hypothetical protein
MSEPWTIAMEGSDLRALASGGGRSQWRNHLASVLSLVMAQTVFSIVTSTPRFGREDC